jgi:hypothetical protein
MDGAGLTRCWTVKYPININLKQPYSKLPYKEEKPIKILKGVLCLLVKKYRKTQYNHL